MLTVLGFLIDIVLFLIAAIVLVKMYIIIFEKRVQDIPKGDLIDDLSEKIMEFVRNVVSINNDVPLLAFILGLCVFLIIIFKILLNLIGNA